MGAFDEYINGLEGRNDIDPLTVARDLLGLYNQDISTREAKIEELNGTIAERDGAISVVNNELTAQKARNFDLAMQIPSGTTSNLIPDEQEEIDPVLTIDDLFQKG